MDVVGSEIGHKMRSAIKAKLTELGCYVDDELPDYVMVMVANKRTRSQMEDDLQLFLGDNTELFVNWLHQVLKKLQEVTVTTPLKTAEIEKVAEKSTSKEKKSKDKKDKSKKSDSSKKSKKKAKEKSHKKKEGKKKSKKKSKHEMIRPNIPPLLMNIEKESEPSITDVFAGQILKNHGIILETHKEESKSEEQKPILAESKRLIIPIIDPATIPSQNTDSVGEISNLEATESNESSSEIIEPTFSSKPHEILESSNAKIEISEAKDAKIEISEGDNAKISSIEKNIEEMTDVDAKIEGLKQKLADQSEKSDSTDDEDFLNIRTEADELINDFGEDVYKENSQSVPIVTPPLHPRKSRSPSPSPPSCNKKNDPPKEIPETLPHIELNLPKRPIRERLGAPTQKRDAVEDKEKGGKTTEKEKSPERYTPEKEPEGRHQVKSAKSRLGGQKDRNESQRKSSTSDESGKTENISKRLTSRVSVLENRPSRATCASVVRVRPRPRVSAPASSLLLRAVADAHKSLFNIPPKIEPEAQKVKRALVLPMRRNVDTKKIVIQVPCTERTATPADSISDNVSMGDLDSDEEAKSSRMMDRVKNKDEYTPFSLTKVIHNTEYVPSKTLVRRDDSVLLETINIHNTTVDKDKGTQFIVTMDGYHPNAFLAKKLLTEGLLNDEEEAIKKPKESDKTEKNTKGPQAVLQNVDSAVDSKVTIEVANVHQPDAKSAVQSISSHAETSNEPSEIPKELTREDNITPPLERRKSYTSIENLFPEKGKSNVPKEKPVLEKRKSDSFVEKPILEKRKSDSFVDDPILEQENDSSKEKPILEKRKSSANTPVLEKRKSDISVESLSSDNDEKNSPPVKRRKASPIIFDVHKKEKDVDRVRERTVSASSDSVVLTTASNTHKYDTLPPLSQASKPVWCRAFPQCRYGSACAFSHPRCKFAAACTRRGCPYSHAPGAALAPPPLASAPVVASHVVPAANYKSISAGAFANLCKFYPSCSNPACHYYHPKPCRYGKACTNKLECNFYHHDAPGKWKYSI